MARLGYVVVGLLTVSLLDACGSASPPLLQGTIKVDQAANPNLNGRASPIVVRVYELRSSAAFSGADFFSLFDNESETLAGDLVGREEYGLSPAETQPYRRQLQPDTKFIGVVAAFRDLEHSRWRQVVPVPAERQSTIAIGIEARAVTLTVGPEGGSFFSKVFPWLSKEAPLPSKDAALPSKDAVLPSKDAALPSKDALLAQANGMATDLATMKSSGKLTPEQATQTGKLLVKATTLKSDLENLKSVDPLKLSQLMSTLVDLQQQVGALKTLVK
jgi:type VI secretion system protein VasD